MAQDQHVFVFKLDIIGYRSASVVERYPPFFLAVLEFCKTHVTVRIWVGHGVIFYSAVFFARIDNVRSGVDHVVGIFHLVSADLFRFSVLQFAYVDLHFVNIHQISVFVYDTAFDCRFGYAVFDAPQLFESGIDSVCDIIVSVVADKDVRLKRIISRDGISE
ncbi:MAG: dephospho-CoA kinase, partial [Clostridia bacterium]|nr:dephospho-CoA kinase [Clostridia bacterium]